MTGFLGVFRPSLAAFATSSLIFASACSTNPTLQDGAYDPFEQVNRAVHQVNKGADRFLLRPVSHAYAAVAPDGVEWAVSNAASNLSLPSDVINHTFQGDLEAAVRMSLRFVINSTIGVFGLFDPATAADIPDDSTDFGETLSVWGASEGPYLELPIFGPSTSRDAVGLVVDTVLDPVSAFVPTPELNYIHGVNALDLLGNRHTYTSVIDQTLYESEDSYTAAKIGYLGLRRNALSDGEIDEEDLEDPFAF